MILLAWKATWPTTSPVDLVPCRVRALLDLARLRFASGSHERARFRRKRHKKTKTGKKQLAPLSRREVRIDLSDLSEEEGKMPNGRATERTIVTRAFAVNTDSVIGDEVPDFSDKHNGVVVRETRIASAYVRSRDAETGRPKARARESEVKRRFRPLYTTLLLLLITVV